MDNPGLSLFQGADIQVNNSKNNEEEEDLEDQQRRKEELQNLLQANLDDFKYDDSTINSSVDVSLVSVADNIEQFYKDAITPDDQLKVLYDVRCREIQSLKEKFETYKHEKQKEIESQKHQNLLLEAELRQTAISLKNAEDLLVDKTESIHVLSKALNEKDTTLELLEKRIHDYESELATYKSELSEVHLRLQAQNVAFNMNDRFGSEEIRKSLDEKIESLENIIQDQAKKLEIQASEKKELKQDIEQLRSDKQSLERDNRIILENFDDVQKQCKDMMDVIEALKKENEHFKGRIHEVEETRDNLTTTTYLDSTHGSGEKLRKMLVDKSVELDSLKTKLKTYENDLKELREYRQLKCDIYKKEFQNCDNREHTKELYLIQNELQNYKRIVEDKNQQILTLNANNKDLTEKVEEMLLETRHEIQNISSKYNLPQLERMRQELDKAEQNERHLSEKLKESEEKRLSLIQKLKSLDDSKTYKDKLKITENMLVKEREHNQDLLNQLVAEKNLVNHLKKDVEPNGVTNNKGLAIFMRNLLKHFQKHYKNGEEITKPLEKIINNTSENVDKEYWSTVFDKIELKEDEALKNQYKEAIMSLHKSKEKVKDFEETVQDMQNALTIAEGEKCSLAAQFKEVKEQLDQIKKNSGSKTNSDIHAEVASRESELDTAKQLLKRYENEKKETRKWLEKVKKEIDRLKEENVILEEKLQKAKENNNGDIFKAKLEEELMSCELKLRDELQIEYQKRIGDIEMCYQKTSKESSELCKQQKTELVAQDKKFREYLKMILTECDTCTNRLENEKLELLRQLNMLKQEYDNSKALMVNQEEKYHILLKRKDRELHKYSQQWQLWSKKIVCSCLDIEATNKKTRDRLLTKMDKYDQEVKAIQNLAEAKTKKLLKKDKLLL